MSEICREPLKTAATWLGPELQQSEQQGIPKQAGVVSDAENIAREEAS